MGLRTWRAAVVAIAGTWAGEGAAQSICTNAYQPVCGVDPQGQRRTFSNACLASVVRARQLHPGPCFGPFCTFLDFEVCAFDGRSRQYRTFKNVCYAEIVNAVFIRNGACGIR